MAPKTMAKLQEVLKITDDELKQVEWDVPQEYAQLLKTTLGRMRKPLSSLPGLIRRVEELSAPGMADSTQQLGELTEELRDIRKTLVPLLEGVIFIKNIANSTTFLFHYS
jgi:hypothetical protein